MTEEKIDMGKIEVEVPEVCGLCNVNTDPLFTKPRHYKVNGQRYFMFREKPLWICLECLTLELDNF